MSGIGASPGLFVTFGFTLIGFLLRRAPSRIHVKHVDAYGESKEQITVEKSNKVSLFFFNFQIHSGVVQGLGAAVMSGEKKLNWAEPGTGQKAEAKWQRLRQETPHRSFKLLISHFCGRSKKERKRLHTGLTAQTENPHVLDFFNSPLTMNSVPLSTLSL